VNHQSIVVSAVRRAKWTKGLLLATLVLSVAGAFSSLLQMGLLARAASGGISEVDAAANDARQQVVGVLQVVLHLATAVAFLAWFHRAHKNLTALGGRDLKYTPRWAVGGFLIPFLNLVRPLQVMREVWHGSDPKGLERDTGTSGPALRNKLGTPALVGAWWTLFLISGLLGNLIMRMSFAENPTLDQLRTLTGLMVFSDLLDVPAAILAVVLVGRVTRWQAQRAERVRQAGTAAYQGSVMRVAAAS
jgi:hypothetical protein